MKKTVGCFVLCIVAFLTSFLLSVPGFGQDPYTFILKWGDTGSGPGQFGQRTNDSYEFGIAIDSQNNVYVVDAGNSRIQKFDKDGTYLLEWGTFGEGDGQFNFFNHFGGGGIAIDHSDNVYVSDGGFFSGLSRVQKFTNQGVFLAKWGEPHYFYSEYSMRGPKGIDIDKDGWIYLVAGFPDVSPGCIKKFDANFTYVDSFGGSRSWDDTDPYNFWYPGDIAVNSKGDIYVSVWGEDVPFGYYGQIKKFDSNFNFLTRWYPLSVTGIAIDADDNVIACSVRNEEMGLYKFDPDGNLIQRIAPNGQADGEIWAPQSVAIDSEGNLYVGDLLNRIQKFAPPFINVSVDIKPDDANNSINPKSNGEIPVAILAKDGLDVSQINPATIRFGKTGEEDSLSHYAFADVNEDGNLDLMLHFKTIESGILCGDTKAYLKGKMMSGRAIKGSDLVRTVGCN